MAVLQMQKFSICALRKDRNAILRMLQSLGATEIHTDNMTDDVFKKDDTSSQRIQYEKRAQQADQALDILQEYEPEKTSMFSGFEGKKEIEQNVYEKAVSQQDDILKKIEKLIRYNKQIAEDNSNIQKLDTQMESLTPWLALDIPMNTVATEKTSVLIGSLPAEWQLTDIYNLIGEHAPEVEAEDITIISSDKDATCITVICLKQDAAAIEDALRTGGFAKPTQMITDVPEKERIHLEEQKKELQKDVQKVTEKICEMADLRDTIRIISDDYRLRSERYEVMGQVLQSKRTFVMEGYLPEQDAATVAAKLEGKFDLLFEATEVPEDEEAPVLLKNNAFSKNYEGVLESYGLPVKGEIDPTTIMSFFYVFLFGIMLSDAAYGAIITIACFIMLKKFPRMSESMNKSLHMFMYCGISTVIWGILFGGYFGDVVDVVSRVFFGHQITIPALWFIPLNNPMKLLVYSMLFGVIHLFTGLGIKGYICIKQKDYTSFVCDVLCWFMLLIGLIMMLLPTSIFASIAQVTIVFPQWLVMLSRGLAIVGAVGILLMSGRSSKNFGLRIALGAYDLYNITGWLSDVLSYSRLLALGLATGVIAQVINQMGSMAGNGIFGLILFIIIFIVGHAMNLAINLLGAYVHTNRLQYVEFFGKFYESGGRPFQPFKANTKYVDIKED